MIGVRKFGAILAAGWLLGACGSGSPSSHQSTRQVEPAPASAARLQGLPISPAKSAPPLALRNYTGAPVDIRQFRGKAVFVTFVYTHCPDVCPLIVAGLAAAQRELGPRAAEARIVAVTVDPRRDTPAAIHAFLAARGAVGRMDYLIGNLPELLAVWRAWDVGVTISRNRILAGHTAIVYGVTASGRLVVAYPANFTPAQIVHDVPLLAAN